MAEIFSFRNFIIVVIVIINIITIITIIIMDSISCTYAKVCELTCYVISILHRNFFRSNY